MNILDIIAEYARLRVKLAQEKLPLEAIKKMAITQPATKTSFKQELLKKELSFICECKKASPSKGIIASAFPYLKIAKEYEEAGASCISVLTEPKYFQGNNRYLQEIAAAVSIPCLRKDFVVDEYMLYEAKVFGAAAVLLICSLLTLEQLRQYLQLCRKLRLDALVEVHTEQEAETALKAGAEIIGVNNRDLKSFTVNLENTSKIRSLIPKDIVLVSESGIHSAADIAVLKQLGVDGVLIGEALMLAKDKKAKLLELRGAR